jgi:hypothetical protein
MPIANTALDNLVVTRRALTIRVRLDDGMAADAVARHDHVDIGCNFPVAPYTYARQKIRRVSQGSLSSLQTITFVFR